MFIRTWKDSTRAALLRVWRNAVHSVLRTGAKWVLGMKYNVTVIGAEKIPTSGPIIVASNHPAAIDSYLLPAFLCLNLIFLSKDEYFNLPGPKGRLRKLLLTNRAIPVKRDSAVDAGRAMNQLIEILKAGGHGGLHPEGTRSPPGVVCKGRPGVAQMALKSGAVILPVGVRGTYRAGWRSKITLVVGDPMVVKDLPAIFRGVAMARTHHLDSVTHKLMKEIARLAGLPYVDEYVADYKKRLALELELDE